MASMTRDSSPPEAALVTVRAGVPGLAASRISTSSTPCGPKPPEGVRTTLHDRPRHTEPGELTGDPLPQVGSRPLALGPEPGRCLAALLGEPHQVGLELTEPVVGAEELGEPGDARADHARTSSTCRRTGR